MFGICSYQVLSPRWCLVGQEMESHDGEACRLVALGTGKKAPAPFAAQGVELVP